MVVMKFCGWAYLPSIRTKQYYIACACDEIFAPLVASIGKKKRRG